MRGIEYTRGAMGYEDRRIAVRTEVAERLPKLAGLLVRAADHDQRPACCGKRRPDRVQNLSVGIAGRGLVIPVGAFARDHPDRGAAANSSETCAANLDHDAGRSEEHTSELQSLRHLVCRL